MATHFFFGSVKGDVEFCAGQFAGGNGEVGPTEAISGVQCTNVDTNETLVLDGGPVVFVVRVDI
jgi:hypothetical protein